MANPRIFISMGTPYAPKYVTFRHDLERFIRDECRADPRIIGVNEYPTGNPLAKIREVMRSCSGVMIVAYFGLALQFFLLRFGRKGTNYLSLFLFLVWVVPLIAGTIMAMSNFQNYGPSQTVFALSPIAGLGLTAGAGSPSENDHTMIAAAALTPSLLFAFVFNGLVTSAQRRVHKAALLAMEEAKAKPQPFD